MSCESVAWLLEGPVPILDVCNIIVAFAKELQGTLVHTFRCHPSRRVVVTEVPGGQVACGSDDGSITVWDVATGQRLMLVHHTMWISAIAALPDHLLVVGDWVGDMHVWDHANRVQLRTLKGHAGCVDVFIVLPDGKLVSGSSDDTMRVWDAARGTCVCTLEGHTGAVRVLALLPAERFASGSTDHTVRVWDTASWTCVWTLMGHRDGVCSLVVVSPFVIASGSSDGTVGPVHRRLRTGPQRSHRLCVELGGASRRRCGVRIRGQLRARVGP